MWTLRQCGSVENVDAVSVPGGWEMRTLCQNVGGWKTWTTCWEAWKGVTLRAASSMQYAVLLVFAWPDPNELDSSTP